jgi:predicted nucleic acid-binding protein
MKYLLDTNVISEIQKPNCNQNVKNFTQSIQWENAYLSVITIGELCYGIEKLPNNKKKHDLSVWLYSEIPLFLTEELLRLILK